MSICLTANAKTYVLLDKLTDAPKGTASIADSDISDWSKKSTLIEADESYRGKQPYEVKYENGKLRHATTQEISDYLAQQEQEQETMIKAKKKQELLSLLDDADIKTKVKNIK